MPTYEYGCAACGSEWEQVQRITEPPLEVCPKCGKTSAHRLISRGAGFILKGGGWYSDLYSSPKPGAGKSETHDAAPAEGAAAGKSEGAPAKADAGGTTTETKASPSTAPAAATPASSTPASSSSS